MGRNLSRSLLFATIVLGTACSASKGSSDGGPKADSGPAADGGPVDAGPACTTPPTYPVGTLGGLDCDPLVPQQCGFPFPSNVYLVSDTNKETCFHVQFGATTLPAIAVNPPIQTSPNSWQDSDGFSPGGTAMAYLPGATTTGMPDQNNIANSLDAGTTPTILLDTSTNPPSLVPHFAELDVTVAGNPLDRAILIHPMIRLKDDTRYIVAIRNIVDATSAAIAPSPTFAALLNGTAAPMISVNGTMETDPSVAPRTALYADIFAKLNAAGITKTGLQLAWDFTTASKQNNVGQLESMYTQALAALPASGPAYTITSSVDNPDTITARRIRGLISVPLFLDQAKVAIDANMFDPDLTTGYTMMRNNGVPVLNGTGQFEFIVNIPASATTNGPLPILIQGHGLFSDRGEEMNALDDHYNALVKLANNQQFITISLDMIGWRQPDSSDGSYNSSWPPDWGAHPDTNLEDDQEKALGFVDVDIGGFRRMIDRATQGMLNQLIAVKMMETSFAADPAVQIEGKTVLDPTHAYYRGDSQGALSGTTFMALTHDCVRGYLGEGGIPYSFIIFRSQDFAEFLTVLLQNYSAGYAGMNIQLISGLMQMFWDRWEGDGFAPYITSNTIDSATPSHQVFLVDALGDHQVTPLGAQTLARTLDAVQLEPGIRTLYGIPGMTGPITGQNVLQEFDFGILTDPNDTVPQTDTAPTGPDDPHDWARQTEAAQIEEGIWLKTGSVDDECGGVDGGMPTMPGPCVYPTTEP